MRLLLGLKLRDVNCGFILIRVALLRGLSLQSTTSAIHSEVFWQAGKKGARVREVGVRYFPRAATEPAATRIRWSLRTARELSRLRAALVREKRQAALEARSGGARVPAASSASPASVASPAAAATDILGENPSGQAVEGEAEGHDGSGDAGGAPAAGERADEPSELTEETGDGARDSGRTAADSIQWRLRPAE